MKLGSILIVIAATLWALDGLLRRSLYGLSPSTLIFFEHIIGFLLIAPFALRESFRLKLTKKEISSLLAVSLLSGVIGTLLFTLALSAVNFISLSVVILIQKLQPIFAIGVAVIVRKEHIPKRSFVFILLALVAGYFVTFPHGVSASPDGKHEMLAALYAFGAALAWGVSTNFSKFLLQNHHPKVITLMRFGLTTLLIGGGIILFPSWNEGFRIPTLNEWMYLFLIAFSTGGVAMYLYYRGLKMVPVHVSAILELTWPIVAVVIDYCVYGTVLTVSQYIAMIVLVGGMYQVIRLARLAH